MKEREFIARVDGKGSDDGASSLLAYRLGARIEIVVTEEEVGDATVFLTEDHAKALVEALTTALKSRRDDRAR
jgi:hypothetical protein